MDKRRQNSRQLSNIMCCNSRNNTFSCSFYKQEINKGATLLLKLGILTDQYTSNNELINIFQSSDCELLQIKEQSQLTLLDGLVIEMNGENRLVETIDWLIASNKNPSAFVWIYSNAPIENEKKILFELGANDVITSFADLNKLSYIVKNTFSRVRNRASDRLPKTKHSLLNERNQTVFVNGKEKELTLIEYRLFSYLYERANDTVSYEELCEKLWNSNSEENRFRLANLICFLRKKTNKSDQFSIKTTRSKGYVLKLND